MDIWRLIKAKRVFIVGLALLLSFVLILGLSVSAKPSVKNPLHLVRQGISSCGADCNRTDGCTGDDEVWTFLAEGDLAPGQSWTYGGTEANVTPDPTCHAYGKVEIQTFTRGKKVLLLVQLEMWDTQYTWSDEGMGYACLIAPSGDGHGLKHWKVTVTNVHHRKTVRDITLGGVNWGTPRVHHTCREG